MPVRDDVCARHGRERPIVPSPDAPGLLVGAPEHRQSTMKITRSALLAYGLARQLFRAGAE